MNMLFQLFISFVKIGVLTFGGGVAMLPLLQTELVHKRKWIEETELLDFYAISQMTPGIIAVNTATFVGYKKKGILGALFATLGVVSPSVIIISLIAELLLTVKDNMYFIKAFSGIRITVCALIFVSIVKLSKKAIVDFRTVFIFIVCFIFQLFFFSSPVLITVFSVIYGLILYFSKKKGI